MKKLTLDALRIESFATTDAVPAPRGTVRAHLYPTWGSCSCPAQCTDTYAVDCTARCTDNESCYQACEPTDPVDPDTLDCPPPDP